MASSDKRKNGERLKHRNIANPTSVTNVANPPRKFPDMIDDHQADGRNLAGLKSIKISVYGFSFLPV
jgi:hypothetical protein